MRLPALALTALLLPTTLFNAPTVRAQETAPGYSGVPDAVIASVAKKDMRHLFKAMAGETQSADKANEPNPMLDSFIKQVEEQFEETGDFMDANLYKDEAFGERYHVLNYVLNFANKPVGMTLKLYKTSRGWYATGVNFNPDINKFVDELRGVEKKSKS